MSRFLVSAAHKSSGKTTLSIGLCAALRARGLVVQPFKKGPDYIDPLWLSAAAGRDCFNLDFYTMARAEIRHGFERRLQGADVALIEGNKGLYDGLDLDGSNSNAALARLLDVPVVLVIDGRGMTRGIAPLILGYQAFEPEIRFAGVILNRLGGSRHESKLRQVISHYTDLPVLGSVYTTPALAIVERHLGLMPSNEAEAAKRKVADIGSVVADQVDLDGLLAAVRGTDIAVPRSPAGSRAPAVPAVRIGLARDSAFGFYYPDDLERLREAGAELVMLDLVRDHRLPSLDGLFIGGGFPEARMEALEANAPMRDAVRGFVEAGKPVYAECGGLMYLSRHLTWKGKTCKMVGVIPGDAVMYDRPQGRGYVRLRETKENPWPRIAGEQQGNEIAAHEFHYSRLENVASGVRYAYEVLRGTGIDGRHDGIVYKRLLANYFHMRGVGGNHWPRRFVEFVRAAGTGDHE